MTVKESIDPVRIGEEIFYAIFHEIFNNEGARKHFKFSRINFFNSREGLPGWNLWFHGKKGAYQLALIQAGELQNHPSPPGRHALFKPTIGGCFAVRYFPDPTQPEMDHYSTFETLVRLGPLFDRTGTPTLEGQENINDNFFVVGHLDFRTNRNRDFLEMECIAPSRWKEIQTDGIYLKTTEGKNYTAVVPGEVDRNLPGWDLAFHLFDSLITGCCHTFKTAPCAAVLAQKKWFRSEIDTHGACTKVQDSEIDLFHLVVGLKLQENDNGCPPPCSKDLESYRQTVVTRLKSEGLMILGVHETSGNATRAKINPEWWRIKTLNFSNTIDSEMLHCCYHDH
jgi:hypothetical protein